MPFKILATSVVLLCALQFSSAQTSIGQEPAFPLTAKRVLFLGDSITNAGHYISLVEAQARLADHTPELINLGLPSETCSGLSEPDHPFPRPNVHERIDRALEKLKPDVVVACYGMNDGIYYPPSTERFEAYQKGIDGIIKKVHASGAKLVLMTPPAFDPLPLRNKGKLLPAGEEEYSWKTIYEDYDEVLRHYAQWVKQQDERVEMVIDLHTAVNDYLDEKRKDNQKFTMSGDGVHVNHEGHQVLANAILKAWGLQPSESLDEGLMTLISQRQRVLHDAWLSEVGHKRPGVKDGLPIDEAKAKAEEFEKQIRARVLFQRDAYIRQRESIHHVHFPASNKQGELALFADYFLWIPPKAEKVRGIIVHQHGCGAGACSAGLTAVSDWHWRALAEKWDCALMGTSYEARLDECRQWCDPRNGSGQRFLDAIDRLTEDTGHPELAEAPWCLWGHSGGGFWASLMQTKHPERIVGIWLQSGTAFGYWDSGEIEAPKITDAVYQVPVMACPGIKEKTHERFHRAWDGSHAMMRAYRKHDAPFGMAADPRTGHECGDSRYLAIPFFDECLRLRLPESSTQPLKPIDMTASYLADLSDNSFKSARSVDDRAELAWLPSEAFAAKWKEFVDTGAVSDASPPPPPRQASASTIKGGVLLSWQAEADFESGIKQFRLLRDGQLIAEVPPNPKGRFGRAIFQTTSYSDTPEQPRVPTQWLDILVSTDGKKEYQIIAVNGVGLESTPARVVTE